MMHRCPDAVAHSTDSQHVGCAWDGGWCPQPTGVEGGVKKEQTDDRGRGLSDPDSANDARQAFPSKLQLLREVKNFQQFRGDVAVFDAEAMDLRQLTSPSLFTGEISILETDQLVS